MPNPTKFNTTQSKFHPCAERPLNTCTAFFLLPFHPHANRSPDALTSRSAVTRANTRLVSASPSARRAMALGSIRPCTRQEEGRSQTSIREQSCVSKGSCQLRPYIKFVCTCLLAAQLAHTRQPSAHLERLLANGRGSAGVAKVRLRHDSDVGDGQLQRAAALLLRNQARHAAVHLRGGRKHRAVPSMEFSSNATNMHTCTYPHIRLVQHLLTARLQRPCTHLGGQEALGADAGQAQHTVQRLGSAGAGGQGHGAGRLCLALKPAGKRSALSLGTLLRPSLPTRI